MRTLSIIAEVLILIGALNWGLVGFFDYNLVDAIFGGAVLSYIWNVNFFVGAGIWTLLASFLIHAISHRRWVGADVPVRELEQVSPEFAARIMQDGMATDGSELLSRVRCPLLVVSAGAPVDFERLVEIFQALSGYWLWMDRAPDAFRPPPAKNGDAGTLIKTLPPGPSP